MEKLLIEKSIVKKGIRDTRGEVERDITRQNDCLLLTIVLK